MTEQKSNSHLGLGLMAGAVIGMAAGIYLQSKKGKLMLRDVEKKAAKLQVRLTKELRDIQDLTKDKYAEVVDNVTAYYLKSKDIAKKDVPEIKEFLMDKWKGIEKEMKNVRKNGKEA